MNRKIDLVWSALRVILGWTFLWAFVDKVFGLGYATASGKGWIDGGSPTYGFLTHATKGPFAEFFQSLAGSGLVEWLFMLGLLFAGTTLLFGFMVKLGSLVGASLYIMFYVAGFIPPEHNPLTDEHIINAIVLIGIYLSIPSGILGFGKSWGRRSIVMKYPILR